jgi:hypothetical protein
VIGAGNEDTPGYLRDARAQAFAGYERMREVNPRIVFCTISGYGMTGPYADHATRTTAEWVRFGAR